MVQDAVDQGRGQTGVLDDGCPFGQALVGRDQGWPFFVAAGDQLVQGGAEAWQCRQIPQFVEHQDVAGQQRAQDPLPSGAGQGATELVGQLLSGDKPSRGAELEVLGGDADRQHRLAQSRVVR